MSIRGVRKLEDRESGDLPCCGFEGPCENTNAVRYHINTKYLDEEKNYQILCPLCQQGSDEFWDDMWREVYSGYL